MTELFRRATRLTAVVGVMSTAVLLAASPASAHARVVRTTPASGATTTASVRLVSVVFDDPVRLVPRSLVMTGATGAPQTIGAPRVVGDKTLEAAVPGGLPAGRYFVAWRILSDDGHVESGSFAFAVAAAGAAAPATAGVGGSTPSTPGQPVWPVVIAAAMAAAALLGAALVVSRGLAAVRAAAGADPYPTDTLAHDTVSPREHAELRR